MFSVPLMLGCDVRALDGDMLKLVTNPRLIRINQDEEGRPPFCCFSANDGLRRVFVKVLSDNEFAVMFLNLCDVRERQFLILEDMGIPVASGKGLHLTDAFTGEDAGVVREYMEQRLEPHDCAVYLAKIV